ncbi:hypothetical protein B1H19_30805 [Streptomyces gilvosporeus]|uniref:Uncharacterized protein n=1 Tax=Streptomyces gilvosporeus TaxID=553510 RepID=A0A1V0TYF1_9ACTN|nr:hypothetical protein B1H19_30805 [Streptomyces gilvosporeus]
MCKTSEAKTEDAGCARCLFHRAAEATGEKLTCGPAQLDKMLTEARRATSWLAEGASVPQGQELRPRYARPGWSQPG